MKYAAPNSTVEAVFQTGQTGRTGDVGARLMDPPQNVTIIARWTDGIVESPPGSGVYVTSFPAPIAAGDYMIVWEIDEASGTWATEEMTVSAAPPAPVAEAATPTVAEVGSLLRARTKDNVGNELGTFTPNTRPREDAVLSLIQQAANEVGMRVGFETPAVVWPSVRWMIALRAAMLIELSYFPEQVRSDKSAYDRYERMYNSQIDALEEAVREAGSGEDPGEGDDAKLPSFGFPEDVGGMIGWGTRF